MMRGRIIGVIITRRITADGFCKNSRSLPLSSFSSLQISSNIEVLSKNKQLTTGARMQLLEPKHKPLVIMLSWLMAKPKHIYKFVDYYTEYDFDVIRISANPWQVLWPTKGVQLIAKDVLHFLDVNRNYTPLLLHGFSVGGYQWGEVLAQIAKDHQKYQHILNKISGQTWDSTVDLLDVTTAFPMALFPNNLMLQNIFRQYMIFHLNAFKTASTDNYVRSFEVFHSAIVKAPALIFCSKSDKMASKTGQLRLRRTWEALGIKVHWKCWDDSPHVSHFRYHREEYIDQLDSFLYSLGFKKYLSKPMLKPLIAS